MIPGGNPLAATDMFVHRISPPDRQLPLTCRLDGSGCRDNNIRSLASPPAVRCASFDILEVLPMSDTVKVGFVPLSQAARGTLVVFSDCLLYTSDAADE